MSENVYLLVSITASSKDILFTYSNNPFNMIIVTTFYYNWKMYHIKSFNIFNFEPLNFYQMTI